MLKKTLALAVGIALGAALILALPVQAVTPASSVDAQAGFYKSRFPVSSVQGCRVAVTTTATELKCALVSPRVRMIKNCGTAAFDVGSSAVVAGSGYSFDAGESPIVLSPGFSAGTGTSLSVYGRTASGTQTACVFEAQ